MPRTAYRVLVTVLGALLLANCANKLEIASSGTAADDVANTGDLARVGPGADVASPTDVDARVVDILPANDAETEVASADAQPPTISFKTPLNGGTVTGAFAVEVDAADDTGVTSVEYRLNGVPVYTASQAPFGWLWDTTAFATGNWYLSAVAKDAAGMTSEPDEVEVTVSNKALDCGEAPQVKLVYPTDKAVVCGDLDIQTVANGPCVVAKVEFFVGDKKIGEASQPPYKAAWKTLELKDGQHFVSAVATDVAKQVSQQTIAVEVHNKQSQCFNSPTVFLVKPSDNTYLFGNVAIEAEANFVGDGGSIAEVVFSIDGNSIGKASTSPWSVSWDSDAKAEGVHILKAMATDSFDKLGAHQIAVTVDRTKPTVNLVAPEGEANLNGDLTPVTVAADAADNLALVAVSFEAVAKEGVGVKDLGTVKTKPWQVKWATAGSPSGSWTLTATATDAAGHTSKATRTVTLDRPPTVEWTKGWQTGKPLAGKVAISGLAEDDLGILGSVKVAIDGQAVPASGDGNTYKPFNYEWDTALAAFGDHELVAEVEDSGGHKAKAIVKLQTDQPLAMSVDLCSAAWQNCNAPPFDPTTEYTGKVYLQVQAKDDNADLKLAELQVDGATVQALSAAPWKFTWDSGGVKDGQHQLGLKVTTSLPETKTETFGLSVNNCDLDHDNHLAASANCGGDDCNDAAVEVYGGATDAVGNSADDNCDGIDGVDGDGDKVASLASGGTDCNDLETAVFPGATDSVGDGTDQNCDGADGVDADGDGWGSAASGGKDCNDADAKVKPGATDAVGNSADDNCDGIDGVDGDGDKAASLASGGTDCDDSDETAYPCADELAGAATDSNCDGKIAASCDDCQACSLDLLSGGKCEHVMIAEGGECSDGNACTVGEVCGGAVCAKGQVTNCDDANACTNDSCDAAAGCVNAVAAKGFPCEVDGSLCTPDACAAGTCVLGIAPFCQDNDVCTADSCNPLTGKCVYQAVALGTSCDDGDPCTLGDSCATWGCLGVQKACGATQVCDAGACVELPPPGMVLIGAGKFLMGCVPGDSKCEAHEKPQHEVDLPAFYMDVYEVTVDAYKNCVAANSCGEPYVGAVYNWGKPGKEQHPVNGIFASMAANYCKWAGGRLPTEAEWEKAARGGLAGKKYLWGDTAPTCNTSLQSFVVHSAIYEGEGCGKESTWKVGSGSIKNGYGLSDMAGNVEEWVSDWYESSYYSTSPPSNPQGPPSNLYRIARGGNKWSKPDQGLRTSYRAVHYEGHVFHTIGFRCARSIP